MKIFKPVYSEKIEGFENRKKILLERWINIGSQIREKGLNLCKKLRPHWNKSTCAIHDKNTLKYSDPLSSGSPSFSTLPLLLVFPTSCKQQIAAKLKQQQALQFAISVFFLLESMKSSSDTSIFKRSLVLLMFFFFCLCKLCEWL